MKEADLILAIGTRLGDAVTQGYTLLDMAGGAPIVQVHPDGGEIGRVFRPALGIVSDLNAFALAAAALEPVHAALDRLDEELRSLREAQRAVPNYQGTLNLGQAMRDLEGLLDADAIVTTDAGNFAGWATRFINFSDRQRYIGPTNGAMGYSVPAAIGAKIAFPDRMVVSLVGDGGFLMTGQELATAFHHGVAPIVLVFNNQMYGTIRMHQERAYPCRVSGTALTNPDFAKFIEAFGGHGEVVSETGGVRPGLPPRGGQRQAGGDRAAHEPRPDHHPRHHRRSARRQAGAEAAAKPKRAAAREASGAARRRQAGGQARLTITARRTNSTG